MLQAQLGSKEGRLGYDARPRCMRSGNPAPFCLVAGRCQSLSACAPQTGCLADCRCRRLSSATARLAVPPVRLRCSSVPPLHGNKRPQPVLVTQQLLAGPRRFLAPALLPTLQGCRTAARTGCMVLDSSATVAFPQLMPQVKQHVALSQQTLTNGLPGWPRSIIAWKSRRRCAQHHCKPLDPPIRLQPVAGSHVRVLLAQQFPRYLRGATVGDAKHGGQGRHRHPQIGPLLVPHARLSHRC